MTTIPKAKWDTNTLSEETTNKRYLQCFDSQKNTKISQRIQQTRKNGRKYKSLLRTSKRARKLTRRKKRHHNQEREMKRDSPHNGCKNMYKEISNIKNSFRPRAKKENGSTTANKTNNQQWINGKSIFKAFKQQKPKTKLENLRQNNSHAKKLYSLTKYQKAEK